MTTRERQHPYPGLTDVPLQTTDSAQIINAFRNGVSQWDCASRDQPPAEILLLLVPVTYQLDRLNRACVAVNRLSRSAD